MQNSPFNWAEVREAIKKQLGSDTAGRWVDPLRISAVTDRSVVFEAPNTFFRDWVKAHYLESFKPFVGNRDIDIIVTSSLIVPQEAPSPQAIRHIINAPPQGKAAIPAAGWGHPLNPRFTFDRFVVGPSNRFAHAASLAVAESPAKSYNPLCIYGGVGLGKTHLMQAVGQAILTRWPERRIVYVSSEEFANELITAIQTRTTGRFRDRYRTVDVLLIDDIQFIAGKEATQEEFFHTFNTLYDAHKQIMLSSDRLPKEISGLEERLVSRFEWGLVTDIQPPDLETRIAIVRKKAEDTGVDVPHEVTDYIASQIRSNIRELEGALVRVMAYCNLFNERLTAALAQQVLKDMVKEVGARVTLVMIQERVAGYFRIETTALKGASRHRSNLHPRQLAMFLSRRMTDASLPEIGQAFGGRDHTTVMHAISKIERELAQDIHRKHLVEHLQQLIVSASERERGE